MLRLSNRVVMAAMTRCRALGSMPNQAMVEYYSQRASNASLLISEGSFTSPMAAGYPHCAGIYLKEHIEAWKKVTIAVHENKSFIFCQLWHCGRASHTAYQPGGKAPVSSTNEPISSRWKLVLPNGTLSNYSALRALTSSEIQELIEVHRQAAINSIEAGFDGVEIHGAYGFLIDQFLKDGINDRTDEYGGSIEKAAVKISPTLYHQDSHDSDPLALGLGVVERLNTLQEEAGLKLAHLQIQAGTLAGGISESEAELLRKIRDAYHGNFMISGGFDRELGMKAISEGDAALIAYARWFISNPDLVHRLKVNAQLTQYDD